MNIILVHSSQYKKFDNPWIYFGSSYLKMRNWENQLSGTRVNLQYEIHNQAEIQKKPFLNWIEEQRTANNDSIHWWMTHIAGRNNVYSSFFENLCQLFAIKDYLKKNRQQDEIFVVCENIFLLKLLSQNLSSDFKFKLPLLTKFYWLKDVLYLCFRGLLNQLKLIFILFINFFYARLTRFKKINKPTGDIILFHHCLNDVNSFENGDMQSRYFTILPSWLKKQGIKVYGLPWLFNNRPSINFYKNLRKTNTLIPEDWLNLYDYFNIFKSSFKSLKTLNYGILYPEAKLNYLIFREKLNQFADQSVIFWRYIPAIQKWSKELNSIVAYDIYQNLMFEHPIRYIIKKLPIKSITLGYNHCLTSKEFMGYQHLLSEWDSPIKPDYVLCMGKSGINFLSKQGIPEKKLISAADLKKFNSEDENLKKKPTKQLLILLSMTNEFILETLTKIHLNNDFIVNELKLKVKVKAHPFSNSKDILKKMNWDKLPEGWDWAKNDLNSELNEAYCCVGMDTASVFDAILKGNIVVPLMSELKVCDNYLDFFITKYPIVNSISEQNLASKLKDIFIMRVDDYQKQFVEIRDELNEGINSASTKNLSNFILKN